MRKIFLIAYLFFASQLYSQQIFKDFRANQLGDSIFIEWTLIANYTCNDMILERSNGVSGFKPIFSVSGICGANVDLSYQYLDGTNLQSGEVYSYRVTASNGIYQSTTVAISYNSSGYNDVAIRPNPANDLFSISINNALAVPFYAEIYTLDNKLVWYSVLNDHLTEVNSGLGNGYYFMRLLLNDGTVRFTPFIIQQ